MNPDKLKLSQLRALVAVADSGNFGEAALELNLSQSTVSHAIATLEEELGVILLTRGRHGARLTPVGERIVARTRQIAEILEQIKTEANREKGLRGGKVRVVCFRSIATHILPTAIARFNRHFPDVAVSLKEFEDTIDMERAVRTGEAEIGFTYLPTAEDFEAWEVLRDDYIALLPPHYPLRETQLPWEQLASYPLILSTNNCCLNLIKRYLKKSPHPMNVAYEVREDSTIVSMVSQGLGASILPRLAAEPVPLGVKICALPGSLERIIGAIVLKDALHSPAVFAFLDALRNLGRFREQEAV